MIPDMKEMYSHYNTRGLVVLNIDIMESKKRAVHFSNKHSIPYPTLLDDDGIVALKY
jgi:peroxiredoxin